MIKSLSVKNFQSHKDTKLDLSIGVNTIVGLSDSGKSGFIRALKALFQKSNFYVSYWADEGVVKAEFTDGVNIHRAFKRQDVVKCSECKQPLTDKGICTSCGNVIGIKMKEDFYLLDGEKYQKFGTKLIDLILEKTKIYPIAFLDYEEYFNFTEQHEDMFFIGKTYSGGIRNKILSSMIPDSEKVDLLIKKLNSEKTSKNSEFDFFDERMKTINTIVKNSEKEIEKLDLLINEIEIIEENIIALKSKICKLNSLRTVFKDVPDYDKLQNILNKILSNIEILKKQPIKISTKVELLKKLNLLKNELGKNYNFEKITIPNIDIETCMIITKKINNLKELDKQIEDNDGNPSEIIVEQIAIDEAIESLKGEICEAICPITNEIFCEQCKNKIIGVK